MKKTNEVEVVEVEQAKEDGRKMIEEIILLTDHDEHKTILTFLEGVLGGLRMFPKKFVGPGKN